MIQVTALIGPPPFNSGIFSQGGSFTPTEPGTYTISASFQGQFETRVVEVTGNADAGLDQTVNDCSDIILDGSGSEVPDPRTIASFSWVKESTPGGANLFNPHIPSSATSPTIPEAAVDVSSDTTYTFTLTIQDDLGTDYSDSVDITVIDGGVCGGGGNPPSVVTGLTANAASQTQIDLSWTAPADEGDSEITGYKIERKDNPSGFFDLVSSTGNKLTAYSDTTVMKMKTYEYRISAINDQGTGPTSNVAQATTPP
jgi:hypothetical protein